MFGRSLSDRSAGHHKQHVLGQDRLIKTRSGQQEDGNTMHRKGEISVDAGRAGLGAKAGMRSKRAFIKFVKHALQRSRHSRSQVF